jgi:ParB-like chromosome segregation protein Spo0J
MLTPIGDLTPHPRNARRGDVRRLAESLGRFGQLRPIRYQESTGHVVAGNHTLAAAGELGWTHVAAVPLDVDDAEALAILVADNRTADLGDYDELVLGPLLARIGAGDAQAATPLFGTGYDADDVDDLLARIEALPETSNPDGFAGGYNETADETAGRTKPADAPMHELVLAYDTAEASDAFDVALSKAADELGTDGIRETILRAVLRAAGADEEPAS